MIKGKNYSIDQKNFLAHEWIGLGVLVLDSTDPVRKGTKGIVVDETQNTFVVNVKGIEVIIPKKECIFEFDLKDEKIVVKGNDILKRPEDRIKEL